MMLDYIVSRLAMMRRGEFDWRSIRYRVMRVFWRIVRLATGFGTPIWIAHHSGWQGIGIMTIAIAWFLFLVILIDSTDVGGVMERFMAIARRVIPAAGSEWPLTEFGRVFATDYAADVIRAEFEIMLAEIKAERDESDRAAGAAQRKLDALLAERLATTEAAE